MESKYLEKVLLRKIKQKPLFVYKQKLWLLSCISPWIYYLIAKGTHKRALSLSNAQRLVQYGKSADFIKGLRLTLYKGAKTVPRRALNISPCGFFITMTDSVEHKIHLG